MKIKTLTIKNIASIESAEIQFDQEPLSVDPIFLITGDTGTGKTTILNAICLALYNQVPAFATMDAAGSDSENLNIKSPVQLMRKGTGYAVVELTFTGNDNHQYKARWEIQRARKKTSGKLQKLLRTVEDLTTTKTYNGAKEVDPLILRVVGLSFDQFTRTTMLAQGQFATFMKARDDDKSDILEKLTGTEIYTRIGCAINKHYRDKDDEYNTLDARISGANLLSDEVKSQYAQDIARHEQDLGRLDAEITALDLRLKWLTQQENLTKLLGEKQKIRIAAETDINSDDNQKRQQLLDQLDQTTDARAQLAVANDAQQRISRLIAQMQLLAGRRWHDILDGIQWLDERRQQLTTTIRSLGEQHDRMRPLADILDNAQRIEMIAANVDKSTRDAESCSKESDRLQGQSDKSEKDEEPLRRSLDETAAKMAATQQEIAEKEKAAETFDSTALAEELQKLSAESVRINAAIAAVEEYQRCLTALSESVKRHQEAADTLADTARKLDDAIAHLPAAKDAYTRCEAFLQGQMELKDHIASLRSTFAQTGECPLCGSTGIHLHTDEAINAKVAEARAAMTEAKAELDRLTEARNSLTARKEVEEKEQKRQAREVEECRDALTKAEDDAKAKAPDYLDPECVDRMKRQCETISKRSTEVSNQIKQADDLTKDITKLRQRLEKEGKAHNDANTRLEQQHLATLRLADEAKRKAQDAKKHTEDAEHALSDMLTQMFDSDPDHEAALRAILDETLHGEEITVNTATKAAKAVTDASSLYAELTRELRDCQSQLEDATRRLTDCIDDTKQLSARLGSDYQPRAVECARLDEAIRNLNTEVNTLDGQIHAETDRRDQAHLRLDQLVDASPYSREDISRLSEYTDKQIAECRERVRKAQERLTAADTGVAVVTEQIAHHEAKRPELGEDDTLESLPEVLRQKDEAKKMALVEKARLKGLLDADEQNARALAAEKVKLEQLRKERNDWYALNEMFGNSDGSKFKRIAQSYILRILLLRTNEYLRQLSPRYRLDCEDGSLNINVIDSYHGDAVRNVGLLSGGESFVVSLALALGLSSISKARINVDTLFIDEGFGTLDKEILDTVISMLDRLHSVGGRRIGIISHVQDLKDRIPTQIRLERTGPSTSRVAVTTL